MSKETGESVEAIVERGVTLYQRQVAQLRGAKPTLKEIREDPEQRQTLSTVMSALGKQSSSRLTKDELAERAKKGAEARARTLTSDQRKAIASKGGKASAAKRQAATE